MKVDNAFNQRVTVWRSLCSQSSMNTNTQLCISRVEKAFAEYVGDSRVRYTWKCGHTFTETLMVGPKGRGSRGRRKPMAPEAVRWLSRYWGQRKDDGTPHYTLTAGPCPTCVRIAKSIDPQLVKHLERKR